MKEIQRFHSQIGLYFVTIYILGPIFQLAYATLELSFLSRLLVGQLELFGIIFPHTTLSFVSKTLTSLLWEQTSTSM